MTDPSLFAELKDSLLAIIGVGSGTAFAVLKLRRHFSKDNVEIFEDRGKMHLLGQLQQERDEIKKRNDFLQEQHELYAQRLYEFQQRCIFLTTENNAQKLEIKLLKEDLKFEKIHSKNVLTKSMKGGYSPTLTDINSGL